ncbi:MAG: glycosyltransferase [Beutenbergiaceae bacterium]
MTRAPLRRQTPRAAVDVLIGPSNAAGQASAIAREIERRLPDAVASSFVATKPRSGLTFPADYVLSLAEQSGKLRRHRRRVLQGHTHVIFETGRRVLADMHLGSMLDDLASMREAEIAVAALLHGSEIRSPKRHRELYQVTPFDDPDDEYTRQLQAVADATATAIAQFPGPVFVTTPDLLDFVPDAVWLPLVVPSPADRPAPVLEHSRPIVLHAPSNSKLKGSQYIDPVLQEWDRRGRIRYRRVSGVSHSDLMALVGKSDIVVDQAMVGSYGTFAIESMARGRVTLTNIDPRVRERIDDELPFEGFTPATLDEALTRILDDREQAADRASQGPGYCRRWHDGERTIQRLADFLQPRPHR